MDGKVSPTDVTEPLAAATQLVFVPSVCNTFPEFPVWVGNKFVSAPFAVVAPVPPLLIAIVGRSFAVIALKTGAPVAPSGEAKIRFCVCVASEAESVPAEVIGEPVTEKMDGKVSPTDVTEPLAAATQLVFVPSVCNTFPEFPVCAGNKLLSPAVAVVAPVPPLEMAIVGRSFAVIALKTGAPVAPSGEAKIRF